MRGVVSSSILACSIRGDLKAPDDFENGTLKRN